jgi:general stress protein 26
LDAKNQLRARIVEPFLPEKNHIIWMATNPKSRKVTQLKRNSTTTLHYFDKNKLAYVSLMGNAYLVTDDSIKNTKWKVGWEKFYPNRTTDYLLIKFVPKTLELISISNGFFGDKTTWKPHKVVLVED